MKVVAKKKIKISVIVYPTIMVFVFAIIGLVLYRAASFSKNTINGIFSNDENYSGGLVSLNISDYNLVSNKLGLSVSQVEVPKEPEIIEVNTSTVGTSSTPLTEPSL